MAIFSDTLTNLSDFLMKMSVSERAHTILTFVHNAVDSDAAKARLLSLNQQAAQECVNQIQSVRSHHFTFTMGLR